MDKRSYRTTSYLDIMTNNYVNFPNIGFYKNKLSNDNLKFLHDEINYMLDKLPQKSKFNNLLAGNIEKEFKLEKSIIPLQEMLLPHIAEYNTCSSILSNFNIMSKDLPLYLDTAWVNFQRKHEFNPSHNHEGVVSFVLWIKIPYSKNKENTISPGKMSNSNCSGEFEFQYTNVLGQICHYRIPCDQSMENTILIFPSKLMHSVYPFYSTDDYRISVSGNFKLLVE